MKIKVFKFTVSNAASSPSENDMKERWYDKRKSELVDEEEIEDTINDFIRHKNVISMYVNNVDVKYNNNGRGNSIQLVYTILYED